MAASHPQGANLKTLIRLRFSFACLPAAGSRRLVLGTTQALVCFLPETVAGLPGLKTDNS